MREERGEERERVTHKEKGREDLKSPCDNLALLLDLGNLGNFEELTSKIQN